MSKLDYITIAIVAICILAIIFLVYKMTDLFGDKPTKDKIENVSDQVETEDDTYDPSADLSGDASTDESETPGTSTETTGTETSEEEVVPSTPAEEDIPQVESETEPLPRRSTGGKYMVFAGTFTKKSLADAQVRRLRANGYENAKVEIFDRGKYAVVLVDRFNSKAAAERLRDKLEADGVKCYVKAKQGG